MKKNSFNAKYIQAYTKPNGVNIMRLENADNQIVILIINQDHVEQLSEMHHWYNWKNICSMKTFTDKFRSFLKENFDSIKLDYTTQPTFVLDPR